MTGGVGHRNPSALGNSKQREAVEPNCVDQLVEIAHPRSEREILDVPVREPIATLIVAEQRVVLCKLLDPVRPDRTLPLEFQMVKPIRGFDERWTVSAPGVGDVHSIFGYERPNLLRGHFRSLPRLALAHIEWTLNAIVIAHRTDEAIALSRNGFDKSADPTAKDFPKLRDAVVEVVFFHNRVRPDFCKQLTFAGACQGALGIRTGCR